MTIPFSVGGVRGKLLRQRSDRRRVLALFASLALAAWLPNSAAAITAVEANDARFQSEEPPARRSGQALLKFRFCLQGAAFRRARSMVSTAKTFARRFRSSAASKICLQAKNSIKPYGMRCMPMTPTSRL